MATIQRSTDASSLAEVVGRILDKGIVVDAWARVSLIVIELLAIEDRVVMPPIAKLFSAPWRGLIWVAHELHTAANRERSAEEDELMQSLYALLLRHERDKIGESQFAAGEAVLLERIDLLKLRWPCGPRRCRHRYGSASPTSSAAYV